VHKIVQIMVVLRELGSYYSVYICTLDDLVGCGAVDRWLPTGIRGFDPYIFGWDIYRFKTKCSFSFLFAGKMA